MSEREPKQYVRENQDTIKKIIRHGDDRFVRALCLAALVRYGDDPNVEDLVDEVRRAREEMDE